MGYYCQGKDLTVINYHFIFCFKRVVYIRVSVTQSCLTLCDPMDCSPLSMEFSRQEYWSGLAFSSPGDLPNQGPETQVSLIAGRFFTIWATRESAEIIYKVILLKSSTEIFYFQSFWGISNSKSKKVFQSFYKWTEVAIFFIPQFLCVWKLFFLFPFFKI